MVLGGRHLAILGTWTERMEILVYRQMFIGELEKNAVNVDIYLKDKKLLEEVPIGVLNAKNKKGLTQEE